MRDYFIVAWLVVAFAGLVLGAFALRAHRYAITSPCDDTRPMCLALDRWTGRLVVIHPLGVDEL